MRFNLDNYETVEARLAKFWEQFPNGQVFTQVHHYDENRVVFRAEIYKDISDPRPVATGYAEETRDASPVNRTSHVENAETSAIGRALANYTFQSKTAPRPSREEMAKVARAEEPKPADTASLLDNFKKACEKAEISHDDVARLAGVDLANLTADQMPKLRDKFKEVQAAKARPVKSDEQLRNEFAETIAKNFPGAKAEPDITIKDPDAPATSGQIGKIRAMLTGMGFGPMTEKIEYCAELINRPIHRMEVLTKGEASMIINTLEGRANR
jgi:hypothetical protein